MIPKNEEFDVFVSEGALVEVWRGKHVSVAQQFGVSWDGPTHSAIHEAVFCPPASTTAVPVDDPLPWLPWRVRVWRAAREHPLLWLCLGYALGLLMALACRW